MNSDLRLLAIILVILAAMGFVATSLRSDALERRVDNLERFVLKGGCR